MAKWFKPGEPVDRGPWTGCLRLRWRPARDAALVVGYLPGDAPKLKDAYDAYERRCWDEGRAPEAPEVHFKSHMDAFLSRRDGAAVDVKADVQRQRATKEAQEMTLKRWLGTAEKPGPFWECSESERNDISASYYWVVLEQLGSLAAVPMRDLDSETFFRFFDEQMACAACAARARRAGRKPGVDVPWRLLVPRAETFDGQQCDQHVTPLAWGTYTNRRALCRAMFAAALTDTAAKRFGPHAIVTYNPVPKKAQLKRRGIIFSRQQGEDLRCGLTEAQLELLTEAHPDRYSAIPAVAAFTLNRGGQELTGMQIEDFSWQMTDDGRTVGVIEIRHFHRRLRNGRRVMSDHGKTEKTTRTVFIPHSVAKRLEEHIEKHRSRPSSSCAACEEGVRHWGGPLRNNHAANPHTGCDFAADAPLWVNERGDRLDPKWYVDHIWHPACAAAGLTVKSLGWKPQLKHSRSTGTTLHLLRGTPISEVIRLGGWTDEKMVRDHYDKIRRESRAIHVAGWDHEEPDGEAGLDWENRRLRREIERLRAVCGAHGIDPDHHPERVVAPMPTGVFSNSAKVLDAVVRVGGTTGVPKAVLQELGLSSASGRYESLAKACATAGIPALANGNQLPHGLKPGEREEWKTILGEWTANQTGPTAGFG